VKNKVSMLSRPGALVCVIAGLILLVGHWLSGCGGCGNVGCANVATLTIPLADDVSVPEGSTATACLNDTCVTGGLPASTAVQPGLGATITFPLSSGVFGVVWPPDVSGQGNRVEISWGGPGGLRVQTGDRFSVTLTDDGGATIATKQATASSVVTSEPNGSSCGPTCYVAQVPQ
jgi:hypothetical protein